MSTTLIEHAACFDGVSDTLAEPLYVAIEGDRIREVSDRPIAAADALRIDGRGKTLMPGLIDAHVHVYAADLNLARMVRRPWTYLAHYAGNFLEHMLACGYTTVRDVGGGDHGLAAALRDGLLEGPSLYYGGRVLSQTGGHGDLRVPDEDDPGHGLPCGCSPIDQRTGVVADGVDGVTRAVREELRRGAHHIKIMASGGVASPSDPLHALQYSDAEIRAIVEECERHGSYVAAHCHPDRGVRRCVELGVRTIEHATLIEPDTAEFVARSGSYLVPTMAIIFACARDGAALGLPPASVRKLGVVAERALQGLQTMRDAGCRVGFGTDLLGPLHDRQGTEFEIRREVFSAAEILRQATSVNAEILRAEGEIGCVRAGARADLLLVDGDPIADIGLLAASGLHLAMVMQRGVIRTRQTGWRRRYCGGVQAGGRCRRRGDREVGFWTVP